MKEDVLEQLTDDYLMHEGYFTRHNIKFRPDKKKTEKYDQKKDSVPSDIDVIGIHPHHHGPKRVLVANCKAWQEGFDLAYNLKQLRKAQGKISGREAWKSFRELMIPKWSTAFREKIKEVTGSSEFTYLLVVTFLRKPNDRSIWENDNEFREAIGGNPLRILTLSEILDTLSASITTTPAASEIGRVLQLIKAAGWKNDRPRSPIAREMKAR